MAFAGISYLAVVVAAAAGFAFGAIWYSTLSRQWMAASGITEADIRRSGASAAVPFVVAAVCQLFMAFMLAGVIGHLGQVDVATGLLSGLFIWAGFILTTMLINHRFQNAKWSLSLIDGAHWLGVLLVQGAIIGAFGV